MDIFADEPQPPYTYMLEQGDPAILNQFLMHGSYSLYGKEPCMLSEKERDKLQEYLRSVGWEADYALVVKHKEVLNYRDDGSPYVDYILMNNWQVTFKPAKLA